MKKFIIEDWIGKVCFHGQAFDSFEEAWEFLTLNVVVSDDSDIDEMQEYHIEEVSK